MYNEDYRPLEIDHYLNESYYHSFRDSFDAQSVITLMEGSLDLRYIKINPILLNLQNHRDLYEFLTASSGVSDLINCISNFNASDFTNEILKNNYTDDRKLNLMSLSVMFYFLLLDQFKTPRHFSDLTRKRKTEYYMVFSYVFQYFTSVTVEQKIKLLKIILESKSECKLRSKKSKNGMNQYVKALSKLSKSPETPFEWFIAEEFGK